MPCIIATAHDSAGESDGRAGRSSSARDRSGARPRRGWAQSLSVLPLLVDTAPAPLVTPMAHDRDHPSDEK
jgi:hypothetical protein